jgi:Mn2+/Fe2+ NRAMP family transporter
VLSGATIIGVLLNFFGIGPIRSLFLSAAVNGVVATPLMIMFMSEKKLIVRQFRVPFYLRIGGWVAAGTMLLASLFFLFSAVDQL